MPLLEKPKNLPAGSFRIVDLEKRSLLWPGVYLRPWRLGVRKGLAIGPIFATFNIPGIIWFTLPEDLLFSSQNFSQDRTPGC
jgi:hypothetical protein